PPQARLLFPYTTLFRSGRLLAGIRFGFAVVGRVAVDERLAGGATAADRDRPGLLLFFLATRPSYGPRSPSRALLESRVGGVRARDRKSTRLNSSHQIIS